MLANNPPWVHAASDQLGNILLAPLSAPFKNIFLKIKCNATLLAAVWRSNFAKQSDFAMGNMKDRQNN